MNEQKIFFKSIQDRLSTVNKSYHDAFKSLKEEELMNLCEHDSLLEKVHQELKSSEKI